MQMIVIGMHRSGTSVLARLLNLMGVYFGPEGIGTGANPENPKGFWERRDVRALNDFVLQSAGHDWDRVCRLDVDALPGPVVEEFTRRASQIVLSMDAHRPWMIKEPRLCLLMPLWRRVLEVPVCVHILRHPVEVAASLQTRNQIPIEAGLALWEHYNRSGRAAMRGLPAVTVRHGDLLARPVEETARLLHVLEALGVRGLTLPAAAEIESFVDPNLYRERKEKPELAAYASAPQVKLFERWKDSDRVEEGDFRGLPPKERKVLAGYEASLPPLGAPAVPKDLTPVGKSEYESARKETARLADQVRRLGEECSEVKKGWRDEVARLVEHERELKDRNRAMEVELERLRGLLGQAEKRAAEQAIEIAGFSVREGQLQQEKQSFEGETGRLRIALAEAEKRAAEQGAEIERLSVRARDLEAERHSLGEELEQAREALGQAGRTAGEQQARIEALAAQALDLERQKLSLEDELGRMRATLDEMRASLSRASADREATQARVAEQSHELVKLTRLYIDARDAASQALASSRKAEAAAAEARANLLRLERDHAGAVDAAARAAANVAAAVERERRLEQELQRRLAEHQEYARRNEEEKAFLVSELARVDREVATILGSTSWKATAPLRWTRSLLSGRATARGPYIGSSVQLISRSSWFDAAWYASEHAAVIPQGMAPEVHYLLRGAVEGLNPSPRFDTRHYLASNPDVAESGQNPLVHFILRGEGEGRSPTP
jgi:archaellum component FlaC